MITLLGWLVCMTTIMLLSHPFGITKPLFQDEEMARLCLLFSHGYSARAFISLAFPQDHSFEHGHSAACWRLGHRSRCLRIPSTLSHAYCCVPGKKVSELILQLRKVQTDARIKGESEVKSFPHDSNHFLRLIVSFHLVFVGSNRGEDSRDTEGTTDGFERIGARALRGP